MEDKIVASIIVKNLGVDENGLQQYLWATKKQAERLLEAQFDETEKYMLFMLGDASVRPCDVLQVRFRKVKDVKDLPAFRNYVIKELENEEKQNRLDNVNEKNVKRIEEMKNGYIKNHNLN